MCAADTHTLLSMHVLYIHTDTHTLLSMRVLYIHTDMHTHPPSRTQSRPQSFVCPNLAYSCASKTVITHLRALSWSEAVWVHLKRAALAKQVRYFKTHTLASWDPCVCAVSLDQSRHPSKQHEGQMFSSLRLIGDKLLQLSGVAFCGSSPQYTPGGIAIFLFYFN